MLPYAKVPTPVDAALALLRAILGRRLGALDPAPRSARSGRQAPPFELETPRRWFDGAASPSR